MLSEFTLILPKRENKKYAAHNPSKVHSPLPSPTDLEHPLGAGAHAIDDGPIHFNASTGASEISLVALPALTISTPPPTKTVATNTRRLVETSIGMVSECSVTRGTS